MKINDILSDEEIENLIDGSSDIAMIRRLIEKTQYKNLIDDEDFADQFSFQIVDLLMPRLVPMHMRKRISITGIGGLTLPPISMNFWLTNGPRCKQCFLIAFPHITTGENQYNIGDTGVYHGTQDINRYDKDFL